MASAPSVYSDQYKAAGAMEPRSPSNLFPTPAYLPRAAGPGGLCFPFHKPTSERWGTIRTSGKYRTFRGGAETIFVRFKSAPARLAAGRRPGQSIISRITPLRSLRRNVRCLDGGGLNHLHLCHNVAALTCIAVSSTMGFATQLAVQSSR